jgi:hypothetical protein
MIANDNVPFLEEDEQTVHVEPGQTVSSSTWLLRA